MSAVVRNQVFSAVHTIGGLLPADMLVRIAEGKDVSGSKPADYGVVGSRSVRDEAERHWDFLKSLWKELRDKLPAAPEAETPTDPTGLAVTNWLVPLFSELGFGSLTAIGASGITADDGGKTFPISHRWNHVPIHFAAWHASLDKRPAGPGGVPPQSLLQECLNTTDAHLWGVLTNGRQLRLLRDSSALATASYVEFDLEAIFDGELFSEFVLLYRLLHVSRFAVADGAPPSTCWLEKWRTEAISSGVRALEQLRKGVQDAITTLGTGFLGHPDNSKLREAFDAHAFHNALLRLVYRLLFLFVAEDRGALHPPGTSDEAPERYAKYFSSARLRTLARRRRGSAHSDLYRALRIVFDALGDENGRPELGLPGLGGIFDTREADKPLEGLSLSNEYLLAAVRHLSQVQDAGSRRWRSVDYRNLDAEELGSIYESLLELVPKHSAVDRAFELVELPGNTRKTTGSYYTPSSLIECLLDSALDPVIDDAVKRGEQAASAAGQLDPSEAIVKELLSLTVCDPACGSGHFLVAAARRIAKRVAAVRESNPEPTVDAVRHALREVVGLCIYGVDINPMAVELAKVSLWMEALEPGKPLTFLDAHIKQGNALIGATPALLKNGIPDEAFKPIEGDDKKFAKGLERQNTHQRGQQLSFFDLDEDAKVANTVFAQSLRRIMNAPSNDLKDVHGQEAAYRDWLDSSEYQLAQHIADAWCAAFMWTKTTDASPAVTHGVFRALEDPDAAGATPQTHAEIRRLRSQYSFFHWHLEFPDVFDVPESSAGIDPATGWSAGFDCVVGNPPWERIKLQEQEFFAQRDAAIATAANAAARKRLIAALKEDEDRRPLYEEFEAAKRKAEAESHFLRNGGRYPLTGRGDINTYAVFTETDRMLMGAPGRMGVIVPTGIATDATTQFFFKDLVRNGSIAALYDFENAAPLFPGVHRSFKFSILSLTGRARREPAARFAFFLHDPAELDDADKAFTLTPDEINLLNPNTGTCPVFRSRRDADLALRIAKRAQPWVMEGIRNGNPWGINIKQGIYHLTNDVRRGDVTDSLTSAVSNDAVGLYEAKFIHQFDHRFAEFDHGETRELVTQEKLDPKRLVTSRFFARLQEFRGRIPHGYDYHWFVAYRDIARSTDARSCIAAVLPARPTSYTLRTIVGLDGSAKLAAGLVANLNSFVLDYALRQNLAGTHLSDHIAKQLPIPSPSRIEIHIHFIALRSLELTYVAHDMAPFARDLGDNGAPFRWDEERRAVIRAELDALFFHLYGISRDDVDYIMETFPIVKRKDEAKYGTYRTKDLILAEYARMATAEVSLTIPLIDGENYTSTLNPPPGHGLRHPAA